MTLEWLVLVESNTTGSGRLFCARARDLGLRPVLLARDPGRYPYLATDEIEHRVLRDTGDVAEIEAACAGILTAGAGPGAGGRIAGVTSSSEYSVAVAGEVARRLGLAHPDPDAIRACRDKSIQRDRLRAAGLPGPAYAAAATPALAVRHATRIGYPVVVKPVAGSGSIGVRHCADAAQVYAAAAAVLEVDPAVLALPAQPAVLVEEYLSGPEYSVETLDDQVVGVTAKHLGAQPYFVEIGHDFPAPLPADQRDDIGAAAVAALRALGLGWGAAHVEVRYTSAGPRVIEVNPRLAGGMIPRMVQEATGVDMVAHVVARAAGAAKAPRATRALAASIRFLVADVAGLLVAVDGQERARAVPGVVEVGLTRAPGQQVELRHSFQDRLGYVIAAAPDASAAAKAAVAGVRSLRVRMAGSGASRTEGSSNP